VSTEPRPDAAQRSDARRNRARILEAARELIATPPANSPSGASAELSMAEVARRAGVGRATLYRNFPDRRDLLEALLVDEVDALVAAATPAGDADDAGAALLGWLHRFAAFEDSKHVFAEGLLEYTTEADPVFVRGRDRVLAAGEPLLTAAQRAGHIRDDVTLGQALDLVLAVVRLDRDPGEMKTILQIALDGLRGRPCA
jgi:AcrR family transcriptional regulator